MSMEHMREMSYNRETVTLYLPFLCFQFWFFDQLSWPFTDSLSIKIQKKSPVLDISRCLNLLLLENHERYNAIIVNQSSHFIWMIFWQTKRDDPQKMSWRGLPARRKMLSESFSEMIPIFTKKGQFRYRMSDGAEDKILWRP